MNVAYEWAKESARRYAGDQGLIRQNLMAEKFNIGAYRKQSGVYVSLYVDDNLDGSLLCVRLRQKDAGTKKVVETVAWYQATNIIEAKAEYPKIIKSWLRSGLNLYRKKNKFGFWVGKLFFLPYRKHVA